MDKTVLILGGGWGGLMAANTLRGLLGPEHRVIVVEKSERFSLCLSNLGIMTGERRYPADVERPMAKLSREGVEWVRADVLRIEPETKTVHTSSGTLQGDYIVIALGSELNPDGVPGFREAAHNIYEPEGALRLHEALSRFSGGNIVVLISRLPYRCPAAPYEAAFLLESLCREKGIRKQTGISIYTPEKQPLPVAGPEIGKAASEMLAGRGINYFPQHTVTRIDGAARKLFFGEKEVSCDLLVGIPPHKAPKAVADSGLTDSTGYIPVHPQTMELLSDVDNLVTHLPGVYAIGDVAAIRLMNQMLLPKAGVFAEEEATVVARNIAARIAGEEPKAYYEGRGLCYLETGDGMAASASGNFYAYPAPNVSMEPPSLEGKKAKAEYEKVLDTWFRP